ncbi:MAG TPA: hypothetical protein VHD62_00915 [Opitutaceae bacterium]|nr:hypothetical protein [Opitutaceae bacterium]
MNAFHWLLILGFSPVDAAAIVSPEIFRADDTSSANTSTATNFTACAA